VDEPGDLVVEDDRGWLSCLWLLRHPGLFRQAPRMQGGPCWRNLRYDRLDSDFVTLKARP
jgi:hypothetical protein